MHDQVDYLLLRAEMDYGYFEHHVLREVETNPSIYTQQAINGVAREMGNVVPYGTDKAEAIIAAFERTSGILEQGPANIILPDAAPELGQVAIRHVQNIRDDYAAGLRLLEPHFPQSNRARLRAAAREAARALKDYGEWGRGKPREDAG